MSLDFNGRGSHSIAIHFFTIFGIGDFQQERFRIPRSFVKRYWKEMSNPICLRLPNDDEWKIFWTKSNDDIWFHEKNWKVFAKSLKTGYLLVFKYQGRSYFKVLIFDPSLLEIDYSNIRYINEGEIEDEGPTSAPEKNKRTSNYGELEDVPSKRRNLGKEKINCDTTQQNVSGPSEGGMVKANDFSKKRDNVQFHESPSFTLKVNKSYIQRGILALPSKFWRKYLKNTPSYGTIGVGDERAWKVEFHFYDAKQQQMFITNGWKSFCQDNNLRVNDECEFVMNQSQPISFTITINRGLLQNTMELGKFGRVQLGKRKGLVVEEFSRSFPKINALRRMLLPSLKSVKLDSESPNKFQVTINPHHLGTTAPYIRKEFMRKHPEIHGKVVTLEARERRWEVKVKYYPNHNCGSGMFSGGWLAFAKDCELKVGDICEFEMIDEENFVFQVSITRHFQ